MDNNKQTFEEYMEKHPCPDTNSFTQSDWECSMWENWQEEQNPQVEKKSECDRLKEENALLIKALEDMIKMYGRGTRIA